MPLVFLVQTLIHSVCSRKTAGNSIHMCILKNQLTFEQISWYATGNCNTYMYVNCGIIDFISSSMGGYALALVELIKLAFSVLNRLLARKGKVGTSTFMLQTFSYDCPKNSLFPLLILVLTSKSYPA